MYICDADCTYYMHMKTHSTLSLHTPKNTNNWYPTHPDRSSDTSRQILWEIDGGGTKGGNEGHEVGLMGDDSDAMRNVYDVFLKKHWDILGCSENGDSNNKNKNKKTNLGCQPAKN